MHQTGATPPPIRLSQQVPQIDAPTGAQNRCPPPKQKQTRKTKAGITQQVSPTGAPARAPCVQLIVYCSITS